MTDFPKMMSPELSETLGQDVEVKGVLKLLGGQTVVKRPLNSQFDVHSVLIQGLPGKALLYLMDNLMVAHSPQSLESAIGMSVRTIQRHKSAAKLLSKEQSDRTWKFAEILSKATAVFGTQEEAEEWLERPAIGLDQHRPIELLATTAGAKIVEDFLGRLEFGVYT